MGIDRWVNVFTTLVEQSGIASRAVDRLLRILRWLPVKRRPRRNSFDKFSDSG